MRFRNLLPNRERGEMVARVNGQTRMLKLSLDALARLEASYGGEDILTLVRRFSEKGLSATDVVRILRAGLIGAADPLGQEETVIDIDGGYPYALKLATELMEISFAYSAKGASGRGVSSKGGSGVGNRV